MHQLHLLLSHVQHHHWPSDRLLQTAVRDIEDTEGGQGLSTAWRDTRVCVVTNETVLIRDEVAASGEKGVYVSGCVVQALPSIFYHTL